MELLKTQNSDIIFDKLKEEANTAEKVAKDMGRNRVIEFKDVKDSVEAEKTKIMSFKDFSTWYNKTRSVVRELDGVGSALSKAANPRSKGILSQSVVFKERELEFGFLEAYGEYLAHCLEQNDYETASLESEIELGKIKPDPARKKQLEDEREIINRYLDEYNAKTK